MPCSPASQLNTPVLTVIWPGPLGSGLDPLDSETLNNNIDSRLYIEMLGFNNKFFFFLVHIMVTRGISTD